VVTLCLCRRGADLNIAQNCDHICLMLLQDKIKYSQLKYERKH
jgi:hypothetical protein